MSLLWARALVFGTAAAVLVLEIVAGRLMAPYVGVSLETFTGIIGVVLAGIAAGSWLGGMAADRFPPRPMLGPLIVVSGVLTLAAPPLVDLAGPSMRAGRPLDIVTLTTLGFFFPALTLSAVTPVVVKLRLRSLEETGSVVGSLSAISTIGALAGTFITGFVLLAAMPSRPMVFGLGLLLVLVGASMSVRYVGSRSATLAVVLAVAATVGLGMAEGPCDTQTQYFCAVIEVDPDNPSGRYLWLDTLLHSYVDLDDPSHLELRYARSIADVVGALPDGPIDAAFIGGGGFTLPRYVLAERPGSSAQVFEIDGALVELVEEELELRTSDALRIEVGDARLHVRGQPDEAFDLVVGDAFGGLSVPWHLTTVEFIEEIARVLRPGGVYVLNVIDYPPNAFAEAELATLREVFAHVAVVAPLGQLTGERGGNFVLVASAEPFPWDTVQASARERASFEVVWAGEEAQAFMDGARVLRDDFAPVDQILGRP